MNELLTKLYYGQINISDQKPKTVRSDAESNLFDKLQERLSKDDFNVFQEFLLFSPPVERQNEKCKVVILHEPLFNPSDAIVGVLPEGCLSIESGKNALKVDFQPFTLFSRSVLTLIQKLASDMEIIVR